MKNGSSKNNVKLKDTLFVPALRNNLMSVATITDHGYKVIFAGDGAVIKRKDESTVLTASKRNRLYEVNEVSHQTMIAKEEKDDKLARWHQRYGHLNFSDLKGLKAKEIVNGIKFEMKTRMSSCKICDRNKIHVLPFKSSTNREKGPLDLIHLDICGPINTESLGGPKYFVTFIGDFSRYTEVTMIQKRSQVLEAFKDYKKRIEKQTGKCVKKLRTDNGKEYTSNEFKNYLLSERINRQLTVEYTPQQNVVAERANRTIIEMARCMMQQANVPESL